MNSSLEDFDGPRLVQREEIIDSVKLFNLCFESPETVDEEEILRSYELPRRGGTYAIFHEGRPVSQIGIFHVQLKMLDGTIQAGSIGGVCTHPDFRNQRLASRLLEHCAQQLKSEGATLMLISGARGVYTRAGNVPHGKFIYFPCIPTKDNTSPGNIKIRKAVPGDALFCSRLYQAEPVHFVRRKDEFADALKNPMGRSYLHANPWIVERSGQAVAYLLLGIPYDELESVGIRHVSEYAGSRAALAEAIKLILTEDGLQKVHWSVAWQDLELIQSLKGYGYDGSPVPLYGHTLRILDFPRFMKALRPLLVSRLDAKILRGLRFEQGGPLLGDQGGDRYAIVRGRERLELDGATMTHLVLGSADSQAGTIHANSALTEVISAIFPLPSFLPGLNYH
jgi:GNAT superfamily N-acetyltransferase